MRAEDSLSGRCHGPFGRPCRAEREPGQEFQPLILPDQNQAQACACGRPRDLFDQADPRPSWILQQTNKTTFSQLNVLTWSGMSSSSASLMDAWERFPGRVTHERVRQIHQDGRARRFPGMHSEAGGARAKPVPCASVRPHLGQPGGQIGAQAYRSRAWPSRRVMGRAPPGQAYSPPRSSIIFGKNPVILPDVYLWLSGWSNAKITNCIGSRSSLWGGGGGA